MQEDPRYADEWIADCLERGCFAEAAWDGFLSCPKEGTYNIEDLVANGAEPAERGNLTG